MTSCLIQISVLAASAGAGAGVTMRWVIQLVVVIWSLKADEAERRHAIELLKALQKDRNKAS